VTAPGLPWPFSQPPRLPLVLPPLVGESLSGWIERVSDADGLGWRGFLQALGLKPPARLRSLNICPPLPWLLAREKQTGIAAAFVREHMTFGPLSTQMTWLVHQATPCRVCSKSDGLGRSRQVEWLDDSAPWRLVCRRHESSVLAGEISADCLRKTIVHDVAALSRCLQSTAFSDTVRPFRSIPLSAAACIDMVEAINSRVKLRLQAGPAGQAVFSVRDILMARTVDEDARPWPRNSRAVSAWYAWHVLTHPEVVLHRHTRCRDEDQIYDLLTVLFDFRHTGIINDQWEYALSLCASAAVAPDGPDEERRQVRMLHAPLFRSLMAPSSSRPSCHAPGSLTESAAGTG
jgi:hypothetical protein